MNDNLIMQISDILSIYSYKIDALISLLIENKAFTKDEINKMIEKVMDKAKEQPDTDEYVIEELKKRSYIK